MWPLGGSPTHFLTEVSSFAAAIGCQKPSKETSNTMDVLVASGARSVCDGHHAIRGIGLRLLARFSRRSQCESHSTKENGSVVIAVSARPMLATLAGKFSEPFVTRGAANPASGARRRAAMERRSQPRARIVDEGADGRESTRPTPINSEPTAKDTPHDGERYETP